MTKRTPSTVVYWVVCADHRAGPFKSPEAADRRLDEILGIGACSLPHRIEAETVRPEVVVDLDGTIRNV